MLFLSAQIPFTSKYTIIKFYEKKLKKIYHQNTNYYFQLSHKQTRLHQKQTIILILI